MKTIRKPDLRSLTSITAASGIVLATLVPATALGDFGGSDTLAAQSAKWASFNGFGKPGNGKYLFQNSRLEFLVNSPTSSDLSILRWTPNQGGYNQDWFIQVDVHLAKVALGLNCHTNLNLGVTNQKQGYMLAIDRYTTDGPTIKYVSGFETSTTSGLNNDYQQSSALDATLRVHFDSTAKTLTGSWKSGTVWRYLPPTRITDWNMDKSGTFSAILAASGGGNDQGTNVGPVIQSGEAWYSNFKTGTTKPDIAVEQPVGSGLTDGKAQRSFGSATIVGVGISKTFTIRNTGTAKLRNLTITKKGTNAADFKITEPAKILLNPGAGTTFKVTFKPKAAGTRNAAIHITSNDPDESSFDINLTGQGVK